MKSPHLLNEASACRLIRPASSFINSQLHHNLGGRQAAIIGMTKMLKSGVGSENSTRPGFTGIAIGRSRRHCRRSTWEHHIETVLSQAAKSFTHTMIGDKDFPYR